MGWSETATIIVVVFACLVAAAAGGYGICDAQYKAREAVEKAAEEAAWKADVMERLEQLDHHSTTE